MPYCESLLWQENMNIESCTVISLQFYIKDELLTKKSKPAQEENTHTHAHVAILRISREAHI